jgi:uncharacterized membrane protein
MHNLLVSLFSIDLANNFSLFARDGAVKAERRVVYDIYLYK